MFFPKALALDGGQLFSKFSIALLDVDPATGALQRPTSVHAPETNYRELTSLNTHDTIHPEGGAENFATLVTWRDPGFEVTVLKPEFLDALGALLSRR
ncbi:MAG: hypothetical protein ACPGU1_20485 [Myxococcota bacterium]